MWNSLFVSKLTENTVIVHYYDKIAVLLFV